ncbi:MAG: hypothetical protein E2O56_04570 [Gammaproteobacteria bacterium]|nr:MAG: hypothetical protein E2O56_04570 [Gammaproteobacteria bacterium]
MRARIGILFFRLMALLPLGGVQTMGSMIGRMLYRLGHREKHVTRMNLSLCYPDLDDATREQMVREVLIEGGRSLAELGPCWLWPVDKVMGLITETVGIKHVDAADARGKGVVIIGPHMGAWEVAGVWVSQRYPGSPILYRPPRIKGLDPLIVKARERTGSRLVPVGRRAVAELLNALHRGTGVGLLPDQEPKQGTGVFAPFFGIPAYTMVLCSRLVMKTGATPIFIVAERLPDAAGFRLHLLPAPEPLDTGSVDTSVAAMNRGVEACVSINPVQFQWHYKRFNTRPPDEEGETGFY